MSRKYKERMQKKFGTKWHDAKKEPPKKSGRYMALTLKAYEYIANLHYDAVLKGWNIGIGIDPFDRAHELYPEFWAEMPTLDEVERSIR